MARARSYREVPLPKIFSPYQTLGEHWISSSSSSPSQDIYPLVISPISHGVKDIESKVDSGNGNSGEEDKSSGWDKYCFGLEYDLSSYS
jgi:hypothetical protein